MATNVWAHPLATVNWHQVPYDDDKKQKNKLITVRVAYQNHDEGYLRSVII